MRYHVVKLLAIFMLVATALVACGSGDSNNSRGEDANLGQTLGNDSACLDATLPNISADEYFAVADESTGYKGGKRASAQFLREVIEAQPTGGDGDAAFAQAECDAMQQGVGFLAEEASQRGYMLTMGFNICVFYQAEADGSSYLADLYGAFTADQVVRKMFTQKQVDLALQHICPQFASKHS